MINFSKWILAGVLSLGLALAGCGDAAAPEKTYKVGTDATLVPMSFINDEKQLDGFEVELIRAVAKRAGFKIEFVNVEWAGIIGGVVTNKFDMAISSVTILEERKKNVAFTIPYLRSGLAIVVPRELEGVASIEDFKARKMKVGAQRGTTSYFFLEKIPELTPVAYEQYGHAVADMIKGEVDAVIGESTGTLYYKNNDNVIFEKIKMVGEILTEEYYGIILGRDNTKLKTELDDAIRSLIKDGTIAKLHAKWELGRAAAVPEVK